MSCHIVSNKQINAIMTASLTCKVMYNKGFEEIQRIGLALWQVNHDSFNARYGDNVVCPEYKFKTWFTSYVQAFKLVESLEYQSCECEDWQELYMRQVILTLKKQIKEKALLECGSEVRFQELYEKADWSLED